MVEFLSPTWLAGLDVAVRSLECDPTDLKVEIVVSGNAASDATPAPLTTVRYQLILDSEGARIDPAPSQPPDVRLTFDRDSAEGVARGQQSPQRAIAAGRCRVEGTPDRLAAAAKALAMLGAATTRLRKSTEYHR